MGKASIHTFFKSSTHKGVTISLWKPLKNKSINLLKMRKSSAPVQITMVPSSSFSKGVWIQFWWNEVFVLSLSVGTRLRIKLTPMRSAKDGCPNNRFKSCIWCSLELYREEKLKKDWKYFRRAWWRLANMYNGGLTTRTWLRCYVG